MTAAPRRRVAVVVKGWPRLSETFIAQELRGLELAGIPLTIVSLRAPTDTKRHAVHAEVQAPVLYLPEYLYREPLRVLRGLWRARRSPGFGAALRQFWRDLRRDPTPNRVRRLGQAMVLVAEWPDGAEWLHAHFIHTPASVADYAATMTGTRCTISAHAKDIWTSPDWQLAEKLARARWTVTCTATGHRHLAALAPDPARVHLSYHGLNLDRFPVFDTPRPPRDGSVPGDPLTILSVGRAVPKKGYDTLLHALSRLPADLHWRFLHLGGGDGRKALQALAAGLGIADRCDWRGSVSQDQVLAALRHADVFALACRVAEDGDRDGLPNVLVEAASQALPLVSTTVSAIPEVFADGATALLVPPDDPAALAAALERAFRDPALRARLGQAAADRVRGHLDYRQSIRDLVSLFEREWATP
ncbi:MAG: glycosyltransferase family 4 protein [Paracoccaceae bacterium]|nr:MAG: glycosyltransferase family 4 protein [Paracoccaceae bacterium]